MEPRREVGRDGRVLALYPERPAGLDAMLLAAASAQADRLAVVAGDVRETYAAFEMAAARLAGGMRAAGLAAGDRVAAWCGNDVAFLLIAFAAARAGAVLVPIGEREQGAGALHAIADSGAAMLFHRPGAALPDAAAAPMLRHRIELGSADWVALDAGDPLPPVAEREEAVAAILYTSGTSGRAKGVPLLHRAIVHSAITYADAMGLGPDDRSIAAVPFSHVTGLVALIATMVRAQGTLVVLPGFSAAAFLDVAERERMTHTVMVPAMYNLCLLTDGFAQRDLSAWRIAGFGGAPMPPATIERLRAVAPGLHLMNLYGATETASPAVIMPPDRADAHPNAVGRAVPGCEIVAIDEAGCEVAPGAIGELWIRGAMVAPGYWNGAGAAGDFVDGFWRSGDLGTIGVDGMVSLVGRSRETINRGGFKIYPAEIEHRLAAWSGVLEAAVVARACPVLGQRAHAVVVMRAGEAAVDARVLRAALAADLADYKLPDSWDIGPVPLPRNANGKVDKRSIAAALPPWSHDARRGGAAAAEAPK